MKDEEEIKQERTRSCICSRHETDRNKNAEYEEKGQQGMEKYYLPYNKINYISSGITSTTHYYLPYYNKNTAIDKTLVIGKLAVDIGLKMSG